MAAKSLEVGISSFRSVHHAGKERNKKNIIRLAKMDCKAHSNPDLSWL